jgi:hypothetical protein
VRRFQASEEKPVAPGEASQGRFEMVPGGAGAVCGEQVCAGNEVGAQRPDVCFSSDEHVKLLRG